MINRKARWGAAALAAMILSPCHLVTLSPCHSSAQQPAAKFTPKLEAVAETKLLMEGIHQANYRGLERLLQQPPADDETWRFVRGQALLIAEGGNLLMLRPPRTAGQETWMRRATELRETAATLGRLSGTRDYERSRAALADVANACNRCHQTFRVPTRIGPAPRPGGRDAE